MFKSRLPLACWGCGDSEEPANTLPPTSSEIAEGRPVVSTQAELKVERVKKEAVVMAKQKLQR